MKKVLLATLAVAAFVATGVEAGVKVRPYVSAKAGYNWVSMNGREVGSTKIAGTDHVLSGSVAAGVKVCAFRAEVEFNKWANAKDKEPLGGSVASSKLQQRSLMFNGYFDVPTKTAIRPYAMAGLGISRVRGKYAVDGATLGKDGDTNLAFQAGAGVGYNLTKNWTLDVGYRFVNNGHVRANIDGGEVKYQAKNHQILAGLRYTF